MEALSEQDEALVEAARHIIAERFRQGFHHLGAALRTKSGRVFTAVHLEANVGRVAICAEAVVVGMAAAEGELDLDTIVAVDRQGNVVSPCGMCRELITDHAPDCRVIISDGESEGVVPIAELLPIKFVKRWAIKKNSSTTARTKKD